MARKTPKKYPTLPLPAEAPVKSAAARPPATAAKASEAAPAEPSSWRSLAILLAIFAAASAIILALSWPGYMMKRHTAAAEREYAAHNYAGALQHLRYIVKIYPSAWTRQAQIGDCELELEHPAEALAAYQTALRYEPNQELDARMGRAYFLQGNLDKALELLQKTIKKSPNDPYANFYIGLYYLERKNYAKAAFFLQGAAGDAALFEQAKPRLAEIEKQLAGTGA